MTTTHTGTPEGQVLVVGAGPTGLTLAAQLLARGIHARVIDKGAGPASQSRALSIQARTLELLDAMGLADAFVDHGHRVRRLRWHAGQRNLCDLDLARNGSRYGFVLDLPQSRTETLLRARVQELGGTIEQRVELVRLAERGGAVDATLCDAAGREIEVSAGYVVGCDGAHSRVRHEIRLPFEGQPYPQDWLLADVALDGADSDGAFKSKPWWDRAAAAGGIAGLAAVVPYRIAASSTGVSGPGHHYRPVRDPTHGSAASVSALSARG